MDAPDEEPPGEGARVARHVFVRGRVQGVAFRWATHDRACDLGVGGWVRNLPDGAVEAWLEGEVPAVEALVTWLRRGPPAARVAGIELVPRAPEGLFDFEIRRGPS